MLESKQPHHILFVLIIVITFLYGMIYLVCQQVLRMGANDPQIQMTEDAVQLLTIGQLPQKMLMAGKVDIDKNLDPFIIVYSQEGTPVVSNGYLNEKIPVPPIGVFTYLKDRIQDRFTWQPQVGVRVAAVAMHFDGARPGFVLAGRSLREVETREDMVLRDVILGWLGTLFVVLLIASTSEHIKLAKRS